jgi:hypothetical protein
MSASTGCFSLFLFNPLSIGRVPSVDSDLPPLLMTSRQGCIANVEFVELLVLM